MIISTPEEGYAGRAKMLWKQKDSDPFFLVISLIIVFVIRVIRAIHYGTINWFLKTPISLIGSSPSPFKRHHHHHHLKRCSVSITDFLRQLLWFSRILKGSRVNACLLA
ncbi:hypothetical protein V6N13_044630 [Hibiscus sabdariffa]